MNITEELVERANRDRTAPGGVATPALGVAIVVCMDARIDPMALFHLQSGDAHVIRNAGGVVTEDTIRSLTISQHVLGTRRIVLLHHTKCGLQGADEEAFAEQVEEATGVRPSWSMRAFSDVDEDVRESVRLLQESPYLLSKDILGTVYDVATGRLRRVDA